MTVGNVGGRVWRTLRGIQFTQRDSVKTQFCRLMPNEIRFHCFISAVDFSNRRNRTHRQWEKPRVELWHRLGPVKGAKLVKNNVSKMWGLLKLPSEDRKKKKRSNVWDFLQSERMTLLTCKIRSNFLQQTPLREEVTVGDWVYKAPNFSSCSWSVSHRQSASISLQQSSQFSHLWPQLYPELRQRRSQIIPESSSIVRVVLEDAAKF